MAPLDVFLAFARRRCNNAGRNSHPKVQANSILDLRGLTQEGGKHSFQVHPLRAECTLELCERMLATMWLWTLVSIVLAWCICSVAQASEVRRARAPQLDNAAWLGRRQIAVDPDQTNIAHQAEQAKDTESIKSVVQQVLNIPNLDVSYNSNPAPGTWATAQYGLYDTDQNDASQVPWFNNYPFNPTANAQGQAVPNDPNNNMEWSWVPQQLNSTVDGMIVPNGQTIFNMDTSNVVTNETVNGQPVVQPWYIMDKQWAPPQQVKRAVIVLPGKPRDSWKYVNLVYNTLSYAISQPDQFHINPNEVLLLAPVVLNLDDVNAGGVVDNWIAYKGSNWQMGGSSHHPNLTRSVTFYAVLDKMIDKLMNQTLYPNLNQVVVAGHSLGGQATMRYALTRKQRHYDSNVRFWFGNPGSLTWLTNSTETPRPLPSPVLPEGETCAETVDRWPYGLGNRSSLGKYARTRVFEDVPATVELFRWRNVHHGMALLDNGAGDTHCEAQYQGYNHLQRSSNFVMSLANMSDGWPVNHSISYIAGVSHQDYEMLAATQTMNYILTSDYNTRFPDLWNPNKPKKEPKKPITPAPKNDDKSWEGPLYRTIAWVILAACVAAMIAFFILGWMMFKANARDWDRDYWEYDSKQRLL